MKRWWTLVLLSLCAAIESAAATLRIEWMTPPTARGEKLSLLPVDVALPNDIDRRSAIELWTQSVTHSPRWTELPEGTYRLVLRHGAASAGGAPVELAEVLLAPDEERTLRLPFPSIVHSSRTDGDSTHAAVALRVRSARTLEPLHGVRVTVVRAHVLAEQRGDVDFDRIALGNAVTGANGWARIAGLPEEKLVFVLRAPGRGWPQITEPYTFDAGEETLLDDVLVEEAANVFVSLSLADELRDALEVHHVELEPEGHNHWPRNAPIRVAFTASGAEIRDVPPGTWRVRATGRLKKGFARRLGEQKIEIWPGADQHVALAVTDTLFHGRVTHRGEPVKGVINLQPPRGRRGHPSVAEIAEDGTFRVLLEEKGEYLANVQQGAQKRGVYLDEPVAFDDPGEEVEIELPEGVIRGRVVDSSGTPVKAVVSATRQHSDARGGTGAATEPDGTFVLDFVTPGTWELVAEAENARSESTVVAASDGDGSRVTLVVDPVETITIRVVDAAANPVSNAMVTADFMRRGDRDAKSETRSTDARGAAQFSVRSWQRTQPVNVHVATFPDVRLACALVTFDGDQTITLPARTGEVRLVRREWRFASADRPWLTSSSGCSVPFVGGSVERESSGDQAMIVRGLAPGTWSYVRTSTPDELWSLLTGRISALIREKPFEVRTGGVTRAVVTE